MLVSPHYYLPVCLSLPFLITGEKVSADEQVNLREAVTESLKESSSMQALSAAPAFPTTTTAAGGAPLSSEERMQYEQEKIKLYEQMDEKVCNISPGLGTV